MALSEAEKKLYNQLRQNIIQGMIEEKLKQGEHIDIKWMNETGFHFRSKKRDRLKQVLKTCLSFFNREKNNRLLAGNDKVISIEKLKEKVK